MGPQPLSGGESERWCRCFWTRHHRFLCNDLAEWCIVLRRAWPSPNGYPNFRFDSPILTGRLHRTAARRKDYDPLRSAELPWAPELSVTALTAAQSPENIVCPTVCRRYLPPSPVCDQNFRGSAQRVCRPRRSRPMTVIAPPPPNPSGVSS